MSTENERLEALEAYMAKVDYDGPSHHIPLELIEVIPPAEMPEVREIETAHGKAVTFDLGDETTPEAENSPSEADLGPSGGLGEVITLSEWLERVTQAHGALDMLAHMSAGVDGGFTALSEGKDARTVFTAAYEALCGMQWARHTLLSNKLGNIELMFAAMAYAKGMLGAVRTVKSAKLAQHHMEDAA